MSRHPPPLECVSLIVSAASLAAYEAAFHATCETVGTFVADEAAGLWRIEGVRPRGQDEAPLVAALAIAALVAGEAAAPALTREPLEAEGWLARVAAGFPEVRVGSFLVRGTHLPSRAAHGATILTLDAGLAFGSGEHASTRLCLLAFDRLHRRIPRPSRVCDMGCGSGILAIAAARRRHAAVDAVDNDPWAVRVARGNARLNRVHRRVRAETGDGWHAPLVRGRKPYDLIFANILARPLCRMAHGLASHLAPGGVAILAGLLHAQAPAVLAAHRRVGLRLDARLEEDGWTTLVLRR